MQNKKVTKTLKNQLLRTRTLLKKNNEQIMNLRFVKNNPQKHLNTDRIDCIMNISISSNLLSVKTQNHRPHSLCDDSLKGLSGAGAGLCGKAVLAGASCG